MAGRIPVGGGRSGDAGWKSGPLPGRPEVGDVAAFTTSYFHRPEDPAAEVADAALRLDKIAGVNGIVKLMLPDLSERLDDDSQREAVTGLLRLACIS